MISTKLKELLDKEGVSYTHHIHPTAYTSQEIAQAVHVPGREMLKSVILKADEKSLIIAVLSAKESVNLAVLKEEIGCDSLCLASEAEFRDTFPTCEVGAMPPFGNLFDIPTYCESSLSRNREIEFNAGTHYDTVRMTFDDFKRLVNPKMVHFAQPYREHPQRLAA